MDIDGPKLQEILLGIYSMKDVAIGDLPSHKKLFKTHKRWRSVSYQYAHDIEVNADASISPTVVLSARFVGASFDIDLTSKFIVEGSAKLRGRKSAVLDITHCITFNARTFIAISRIADTPILFLVTGNLPTVRCTYLPTLSACLLRGLRENGQDELTWCERAIAELDVGVITHPAVLQQALKSPPTSISLVITNPHIGHHLWDELGGLDGLRRSGALAHVDRVHVWPPPDPTELYRPIDQIFVELSGKVCRYDDLASFHDSVLIPGAAVAPQGRRFISAMLADRILNLSLAAAAEFRSSLDEASSDVKWKILIGLRVENRCWLDQAHGYVDVLTALAARFGKLAVVFDGHNSADNPAVGRIRSRRERARSKTDGSDEPITVTEERRIVHHVIRSLSERGLADSIRVIDTINAPVVHSIAASAWCDFFISHWGAGLAKYKWIANRPGIVVTNRLMLESQKGKAIDLLIYDDPRYREGLIPSTFIFPQMVNDIPDTQRQLVRVSDPTYQCFNLDLAAFTAFVEDWVAERAAKKGATMTRSLANEPA